jgi:uncharacterized membrane protein YdjX (TVP38/TMEM64 family)
LEEIDDVGVVSAERTKQRPETFKIVAICIFAVLVIAGLLFLPVKSYTIAVLEWIQSLGIWGPVFLAAFYVVAAVLFLPGSVITLAAGALFGVGTGFLAVWIGANLGACAAFLVGRTLARGWMEKKVSGNPKFAAFEDAIAREGFKIVLLLRLSPVFPFNFLNYALGLTKVSLPHFALASLIGMIPGGLMYVYIGSVAGSLAAIAAGNVEGGLAGEVLKWAGLGVTVVVTVFVTRLARRSLKAAEVRSNAFVQTPRQSESDSD